MLLRHELERLATTRTRGRRVRLVNYPRRAGERLTHMARSGGKGDITLSLTACRVVWKGRDDHACSVASAHWGRKGRSTS